MRKPSPERVRDLPKVTQEEPPRIPPSCFSIAGVLRTRPSGPHLCTPCLAWRRESALALSVLFPTREMPGGVLNILVVIGLNG